MAKNCTEDKDTCGTCGGEHQHAKCNSYRMYFCVNCRSSSRSSSDKECPEYKAQLAILNARTPENSMPYFPTEETWTQVSLSPPNQWDPSSRPRLPQREYTKANHWRINNTPSDGCRSDKQTNLGTHPLLLSSMAGS